MSALNQVHFHNEKAAYTRLEAIVWPNGPVCPHCGNTNPARIYKIEGKTARPGLRTCAECRKQFRVTVGTVFEKSKVPLHKWFQAAHLLASSKKGISSHQLHRTLKVTYKTAWFMAHRLREAMRTGGFAPPMGGEGKVIEADETYFGAVASPTYVTTRGAQPFKSRRGRGAANKRAVLALVERGGGVRSFHVAKADQETVHAIMRHNIARETRIHTDESGLYNIAPWHFAKHETVKHSADEYVRGDVTTNRVEGYFSVFKRGMKGVYQHCGEKHLHRYLAEFDFRFNNRAALGCDDGLRTTTALRGIVGKRLTYRDSSGAVIQP